jgi:Secretion system C-terminal sorting domain
MIKSLNTSNSFSQVIPTPASFIAPLCENTLRTISFNNVQYGNPFENPAIGYGSISNYEYLLPAGWKFGNQTSDGVTWFSGNNSASITSDFTSGAANAFIQIRPVNTACGAGLATSNITYIPISRPAPSLIMASEETTLCYPNGYNFNVTGAPANSSITWPVNSYYSSAPSGYSAIISPTSSAIGATNVKATITPSGCSLSFDVQKLVTIGAPYVTFNINSYPYEEPNCYEVWGIYSFQAQQLTGYPNTFTSLQWGWRNLTLSTSYTDPTIYGTQYSFIPYDAGTYELWTKAVNECGISTLESVKTITVYEACGRGLLMNETSLNIYPNPSKGNIKIQVPEEFRSSSIVNVSNQYGTSFIQRRLVNTGDNIDLDLRSLNKGIYQITLFNGKKVIQGKLIRQ